MKNSNQLLTLALSSATPALATCLYAGGAISAEILTSAITVAGLLYIAATDYSPRTTYRPSPGTPKTTSRWIRRSFNTPNRPIRELRIEKNTA